MSTESTDSKLAIGFNCDVDARTMANYAKLAEDAGFSSFWLHEHAFSRDAISFMNSCSLSTSKIGLGFGCLSVFTRNPIVVAMSLATLQETSGGRARLGIGTGFPQRLDLMGVKDDRPIAALKETMDVCRKLWRGEAVTFEGRAFQMKNVKALVKLERQEIPIYVAGWKKQMQSITGKYADGYIAKGGESPQSLGRIVSGIKESADANGRRLGKDIEICAYLLTLIRASKKEALDTARKDPFVNYMLSVQEDYLYEETGIDPQLKKPIAENYFKGNVAEASTHVTDEMLDAFTLCGTEEEIRSRIQDYKKSGLDLPILQPISMKPSDVGELVASGKKYIHG